MSGAVARKMGSRITFFEVGDPAGVRGPRCGGLERGGSEGGFAAPPAAPCDLGLVDARLAGSSPGSF